MNTASHFILYVADQERSRKFYADVLSIEPRLHVPGMTEFELPGGAVLGLMPQRGVERLLGDAAPAARNGSSLRAELYLRTPDADLYHARSIAAGATELSPMLPRDWGDTAAYSLDPDGYVLAFARETD